MSSGSWSQNQTKEGSFAIPKKKILGHLVSSNGVRPDPDKIKASLLKSGVEFHWGPEEVEDLTVLRKHLLSSIVDVRRKSFYTEIHTDASGYGIELS
ncbi:hypothetical protein TNCV_132111 [Trichonephila clavipes]|nr:hypothetical protein TNCV_132111 [Trichonephila clavipes]